MSLPFFHAFYRHIHRCRMSIDAKRWSVGWLIDVPRACAWASVLSFQIISIYFATIWRWWETFAKFWIFRSLTKQIVLYLPRYLHKYFFDDDESVPTSSRRPWWWWWLALYALLLTCDYFGSDRIRCALFYFSHLISSTFVSIQLQKTIRFVHDEENCQTKK